jgi:hypothetical protein
MRTFTRDKIGVNATSKRKASELGYAFSVLRRRTVESRFRFYSQQFTKQGWIDYNHGHTELGSPVRIHRNGIIEKGNKKIDLLVAKRKNFLLFGTHREFGLTKLHNPHEILVSESGFGIFDKKLSFSAFWDHDVVTFIIQQLANGKSF